MNNLLEICISTYGERISEAIKVAESLVGSYRVMIVHQSAMHSMDDETLSRLESLETYSGFKYIYSLSTGVSKSRNIVIDNSASRYVWFLDDDVTVDFDELQRFSDDLNVIMDKSDVVTVGVLDENGKPRRQFPKSSRSHGKLSILSVGTIEIIINRDKVRKAGCYFPEYLGAGTSLPIADEPVFISRCMDSKLKVGFVPYYFVSHPKESSGSGFLDLGNCRARGVAFREIYGAFLGSFLLLAMYAKNIRKVSFFSWKVYFNRLLVSLSWLFK